MEGVPLFPPEWQRFISKLPFPGEHRLTRSVRYPPSLGVFCQSGWFSKVRWEKAPAIVAAQAAEAVVASGIDTDFLDHPALSARIETGYQLETLPLLVSTWDAIERLDLNRPELMALVNDSTLLELFQRLGSMEAALDVTMTTRSWTSITRTGRLLICLPCRPANLDHAFELAQRRHVAQAGFRALGNDDSGDAIWMEMLGGRAGLNRKGQMTLEAAATLGGISGEGVRKIQNSMDLQHSLFRRWPCSASLAEIAELFDRSRNAELTTVQHSLQELVGAEAPVEARAALRLLTTFGRCLDVEIEDGRLRRVRSGQFAGGLKAREVARFLFDLSGSSGLVRYDDAISSLTSSYPDVSPEDLSALLAEASEIAGLPYGYLLLRRSRGVTTTNSSRTMLEVAGELPIQEVRAGIERRSKYRQVSPPPPVSVLKALFDLHPEFEMNEDLVRLKQPRRAELSPVIGWVVDTIRATGLNVASRTVLFDEARRAGINQTSVSVYCLLHELLAPAGRGCVSVVGDEFSPEQLNLAMRMADSIRVTTQVTTRPLPGNCVRIVVLVGHDFRDTGVLSPKGGLLQRIGDRSFRVMVDGDQRGTTGVSGKTMLYGFSSALNELEVFPGDAITIDLNFDDLTATLSPIDEAADE